MKKFQEEMKEKAHLKKIKNAKKTVPISSRISNRNSSHKNQQAQLLLHLYQIKSFQSIPAYKLLRMSGLQQYTKGFIERGYGINLGKLGLLTESDKKKLYQDLKILPGHTVKLDKLIETLAKQSYSTHYDESSSLRNISHAEKDSLVSLEHSHHNTDIDHQYQKQLERVLNQYTPAIQDKKKYTFNSKLSQKKTISSIGPNNKYSKTKYIPQSSKVLDFKKRGSADQSNKVTVKRNIGKQQVSKQSLTKLLKGLQTSTKMSTDNIMQIDLGINKIKNLYRSFDGALMSSTIANIDIQQLVYAFAGLIETKVICASQPITHVKKNQEKQKNQKEKDEQKQQESIQDEIGNILRQSYLHPLYRNDDDNIDQEINNEQQQCISEGEDPISDIQNQFQENDKRFQQSSFLGAQSYQFGFSEPLQIFNQPNPTQLDYFKPTIDSIANFIKNIVLAAKMQRQIPIMAAHYLLTFNTNSSLPLTSLNYKRLLVTVLLLASKIWDDESFQTPSFSRTFPEYTTVLLNEMQKQVLNFLDYKLKLQKKDYATIYFKMRKFIKKNVKSYQNKKLHLNKIRQLQIGLKRQYKTNFMTKRTSF